MLIRAATIADVDDLYRLSEEVDGLGTADTASRDEFRTRLDEIRSDEDWLCLDAVSFYESLGLVKDVEGDLAEFPAFCLDFRGDLTW